MKKKINISFDKKRVANLGLSMHLNRCITKALEFQGVYVPCEINVLVTDDDGIRAINLASRQIDRATDVLSFPMHEFIAGQLPEDWSPYIEPEFGRVVLGDMVISLDRAIEQAMEYGCRFLKFFPAEASGGINFLKSLIAPYKHLGVRFMPTGGVSTANVADYLAVKEIVAVGGTWLGKSSDIESGNWDGIRAAVKAAVELSKQF